MTDINNTTNFTEDSDKQKMIRVFITFLQNFERFELNLKILQGQNVAPLPPPIVRLETLGYTSPREEPRSPLPSNAPTASDTWWEMRNRHPTDITEELELYDSPAELEEDPEPEYNITPEEAAAEYTDTRVDCCDCSGCRYCEDSDSYEGSDGYDT